MLILPYKSASDNHLDFESNKKQEFNDMARNFHCKYSKNRNKPILNVCLHFVKWSQDTDIGNLAISDTIS